MRTNFNQAPTAGASTGQTLSRRRLLQAASLGLLAAACRSGGGNPPSQSPQTRPGTTAPKGLEAYDLVFSSNRTSADNPKGTYHIYRKQLATGQVSRLTHGPSNNMNAVPSPDHTELVFYSDRTGNNQIHALDLRDPGHVRRLTKNDAQEYDPTYMPDGHIIFKSTRAHSRGDLIMMNGDGSGQHNLTRDLPRGEERWKPEPVDNEHVLFTVLREEGNPETNDIFMLDLAAGGLRRLTNNQIPDWFPASNPADRSQLAFISKDDDGSGPDGIFTMNTDGSNRRRLTVPSGVLLGDCDDPSWSPDGQHIAFLGHGDRGYDIFGMDATGRNVTLLDASPTHDNLSPILIPAA